MFLSLWLTLETTELLGWLHRGSNTRFTSPPVAVFLWGLLYRTGATNDRVDRNFSPLLLRVAFLSASQTKGCLWMNEYECVSMDRKSTSTACEWNWNLMREAHDPVLILPKLRLVWQKFFPFFLSLRQILEGGGRELVVSKKCPSWGMETTNFHYKVPHHQNEAIHHCSCGTLTTNPALSTLIWHTLCLNLRCLFGKNSCYRVSKSLNVEKKNRKMEQACRNTPERSAATGAVFHCLSLRPDVGNRKGTSVMMWTHAHRWKCCFFSETSKITTGWCFKQTEAETTGRHWPSVYECKLQVDSDQALSSGIARTITFCFQTIPGQMIHKTFWCTVDFFLLFL